MQHRHIPKAAPSAYFQPFRMSPAQFAGLLVLLALASLCLNLTYATPCFAASGANAGNPFENDDFVWDDEYQTWVVNGVTAHCSGIVEVGWPSPPYDYPSFLQNAYSLGTGNFVGWGISEFRWTDLQIIGNTRSLNLGEFSDRSFCIQHNNDTPTNSARNGKVVLLPDDSYWDDQGVYHAKLAIIMESNPIATTGLDQQTISCDVVTMSWNAYGRIALSKRSENESLTNGNALYSVAGAEYTVYEDEACTKVRCTLRTDNSGNSQTDFDIAPGTYYVKETTPSNGHLLAECASSQAHKVVVEGGETASFTCIEPVACVDGGLIVSKHDSDKTFSSQENTPQGDATLALAEYTIDFYPGRYTSQEAAAASGSPMRTWTMRTDADGRIDLSKGESSFTYGSTTYPYKVSGDQFFHNSNGSIVLPLGTIIIRETKAPEGYLLPSSPTQYLGIIHSTSNRTAVMILSGQTISSAMGDSVADPESVVRGGVTLNKLDLESHLPTPLGGASLDGTRISITNVSTHSVFVDGAEYQPNQVVKTLVVKNGVATTDEDGDGIDRTLPAGRYQLREVEAGAGYNLDGRVANITISPDQGSDGKIVALSSKMTFANEVKRADVSWIKKSETTSKNLASVPFSITSNTTGESHIVVSDKNGLVSTATSHNAHSSNTNSNDAALRSDGTVDASKLNEGAGVWFGKTSNNTTTPALDNKGALPYDTYTIQELRCPANEGMQLVEETLTVAASDEGETIFIGTIDDREASIRTSAYNGTTGFTSDHYLSASKNALVIDKVSYEGLVPNRTYTLKASLVNAADESPITTNGEPVTTKKTFVPETKNGFELVEISFDASNLEDGDKVVVFETLLCGEDALASHCDSSDPDQTLVIKGPKMSTTASSPEGKKTVAADSECQIVDLVRWKNLPEGGSYKLRATLMDAETGLALEAKGEAVTAEVEFVALGDSGTQTVSLSFDGSELTQDQKLVVFETLLTADTGDTLLEHHDLEDEGQTVTIARPEIITVATCKETLTHEFVIGDIVTIEDGVECKNLVPGKTYVLRGTLMSAESEGSPLLDEEGVAITAECTFTPSTASDKQIVSFELDSTLLEDGQSVVVFEKLFRNNELMAEHADIYDLNQTVAATAPPAPKSQEEPTVPHVVKEVEEKVVTVIKTIKETVMETFVQPAPETASTPLAKTGDRTAPIVVILIAAIAASSCLLFATKRRRRH